MRLWHILLKESCPKCKKVLDTTKSNALSATVIKSCPDKHYQKEFHPALEMFVESDKVS